MTELQIAGLMAYFLIGLFLADILMVKVDQGYWIVLLFWPLIAILFVLAILAIFILSLFLPNRFGVNYRR